MPSSQGFWMSYHNMRLKYSSHEYLIKRDEQWEKFIHNLCNLDLGGIGWTDIYKRRMKTFKSVSLVQLKLPIFLADNFCQIIWDNAHPVSYTEQFYQSAAYQCLKSCKTTLKIKSDGCCARFMSLFAYKEVRVLSPSWSIAWLVQRNLSSRLYSAQVFFP